MPAMTSTEHIKSWEWFLVEQWTTFQSIYPLQRQDVREFSVALSSWQSSTMLGISMSLLCSITRTDLLC